MGNFHASAFAGVFSDLDDTTMDDVKKYLRNYRQADLPFGVTYKELSRMICKTPAYTEPLALCFDNGSATVNALDFLCGLAVCCRGGIGDKINYVFEAFDFDEPRGKISFDELVVLLISVINGVTRMTGRGVCPPNNVLETIAKTAFKKMGKEWYHYVSLAEFNGFVVDFFGIHDGSDQVPLKEFYRRLCCVDYGDGDPLQAYVDSAA